MAKLSSEHIVTNGKAAFYATIWPEIRQAALNCGWALGLHGSLANDMDIMAMPWTEEAKSAEEMIQAISDCFTENPFKKEHDIPCYNKPNNRVVYTISIWADFYLDINVIMPDIKKEILKFEEELEKSYKLTTEAVIDVITISRLNKGKSAFPLVKNQFVVINREDLSAND